MFRRTDWFCMIPGIISMLLVLEIIIMILVVCLFPEKFCSRRLCP